MATLAACRQQNDNDRATVEERMHLFDDNAQDAAMHLEHFVLHVPDSVVADAYAKRHYAEGGDWLWVSDDAGRRQARQVADSLGRLLTDMGFGRAGFFLDQIAEDLAHTDKLDFDSAGVSAGQVLARLERDMTRAYLRYVVGQRYGFMVAAPVFNHIDRRSDDAADYKQLFDMDIEQCDQAFVKEALDAVAGHRALAFMAAAEPRDSVYHMLKQALHGDSTADGRRRLLCNMERRRWRLKHGPTAGQRYVMVNIPAQQLWALGTDSAFDMRICCGAWKTKTPLLDSHITTIQLNPEWVIPTTIVRDEVSLHAGDSAYFARHRYFITDRQTADTMDVADVTRSQLMTGRYRVAQRSGAGNSLGRIIFRFPNKFSVYLHDTNNRSAFNAERRTISHGCVRIERPFDMVRFLLPDADEWTLDRMRLSIDMAPETDKGKELLAEHDADDGPLRLVGSAAVSRRVPVVIAYYTAFPNPLTGKIETWRDRYEYDPHVMASIKPYLH